MAVRDGPVRTLFQIHRPCGKPTEFSTIATAAQGSAIGSQAWPAMPFDAPANVLPGAETKG
jgi:hypothetical protein